MERPILFNTEMVQAILSDRKTQTRRIIKIPDGFEFLTADKSGYVFLEHKLCPQCYKQIKPPCNPGDILWVRETWQEWTGGYSYKVGGDYPSEFIGKWKPSIHMPRAAARLFLKVNNVRTGRIQDITEDDARKEGCNFNHNPGWEFMNLWDSIYKNWNDNPWVWVIEFERVEG